MSPLGEFLILVIGFTGVILFYSIKQLEESKPSKLFNPNTKQMENTNSKTTYWQNAERTNGRMAMMGFFALVVNYGLFGWIIPGIF